ncbi:hypothetical protein ABG811_04650 [Streptococcus iniae]
MLLKATSKGLKATKQSIKVYANKEPKAGAIDRYDMVKNLYIKKGEKPFPCPKRFSLEEIMGKKS